MAAYPGAPSTPGAPPTPGATHAAPPQGTPPPVHQATGPAAAQLHQLALDAQTKLEKLATGLAQAHADPGAVKAVSQMAEVTRRLITALAKAGQAEQPPEPKHTMNSATDALHAQLAADRQGGLPQ